MTNTHGNLGNTESYEESEQSENDWPNTRFQNPSASINKSEKYCGKKT
jgi:hypothetical protein